jgi:hypothetical protein
VTIGSTAVLACRLGSCCSSSYIAGPGWSRGGGGAGLWTELAIMDGGGNQYAYHYYQNSDMINYSNGPSTEHLYIIYMIEIFARWNIQFPYKIIHIIVTKLILKWTNV